MRITFLQKKDLKKISCLCTFDTKSYWASWKKNLAKKFFIYCFSIESYSFSLVFSNWAGICKLFKEPMNRFPAWRNLFLGSLNVYIYGIYPSTGWLLVMSNQRFLKIVCFRFPTNVPQKNRIYSFLKQNSLSNQNVLFQI